MLQVILDFFHNIKVLYEKIFMFEVFFVIKNRENKSLNPIQYRFIIIGIQYRLKKKISKVKHFILYVLYCLSLIANQLQTLYYTFYVYK